MFHCILSCAQARQVAVFEVGHGLRSNKRGRICGFLQSYCFNITKIIPPLLPSENPLISHKFTNDSSLLSLYKMIAFD